MATFADTIETDRINRLHVLSSTDEAAISQHLARCIDATLLAASTTTADIEQLAQKATELQARAICIPQAFLAQVSPSHLAHHNVALVTVVNFPLGHSSFDTVIREIENAAAHGITEVDFVQPIWAIKSGNWKPVTELAKRIHKSTPGLVTKVILETGFLTTQELEESVRRNASEGINIMKTCTGFGPKGASEEDTARIHAVLASMGLAQTVGIKASGGVASRAAAIGLVRAGATRIGTSRAEAILRQETRP